MIQNIDRVVNNICNKAGIPCTVPIKINGRMSKTLGCVKYDTDGITPISIEFSRNYLTNATDQDIMDTIIHECAHYVVTKKYGERHGHDKVFKDMYLKLGGKNSEESKSKQVSWKDETKAYKYVAFCTGCNNYLCGAASANTKWVKYANHSFSNCCNAPINVVKNW